MLLIGDPDMTCKSCKKYKELSWKEGTCAYKKTEDPIKVSCLKARRIIEKSQKSEI